MDQTSVYGEIVKTAPQADGSLLVYGKATGSDLDLDEQRCDPAWLKTAMPAWFQGPYGGNVREQHDPKRAVGKAIEHEVTADGDHMIRARIVDPIAKAKVEAGVLSGFSIGIRSPRISKSIDAPNGLIHAGSITEISLVDRPCLPTATLTVCKAAQPGMDVAPADFDEELGLVRVEELTVKADDAEIAYNVPGIQNAPAPSPADMPGARKPEPELVKATDVDKLHEPAAGQKCANCGEGGHLTCGPANVEEKSDQAEASGFDRDAAVQLVTDTLEKADGSEAGDIADAKDAITSIGQLIASEASCLADKPSEMYDIRLLLDAVSALHQFIRCEQRETPTAPAEMMLAAEPEQTKGSKYNADQLAALLKKGQAMANAKGEPSYPIADAEDLDRAIKAVGRGNRDHDAVRKYIIKRAKALGKGDMLPDNWNADGSVTDKVAEPETVKGRTVTVDIDGKTYAAVLTDAQPEPAADKTIEADTEKTVDVDEPVEEVVKTTDTDEPATPEASDPVSEKTTAPDLVKTLTGALKDEDSELRQLFKSLLTDDTTAKALDEFGARLENVEKRATPGGPALRRTEEDQKEARRGELQLEASRWRRLEANTQDRTLREGYAVKAAQAETQLKAL